MRRWQGATTLPVDQLILTIGQDLFDRPADLAMAHKLAVVLRRPRPSHPDWRLPELNAGAVIIARNERKFLGFSDEDTGFDPDAHRGKVVVATMHKAKGLEWDRVYLMSVNAYDFPSALPGDTFISEKWFVRDRLEPGGRDAGAVGGGGRTEPGDRSQGTGVRSQGTGVRGQAGASWRGSPSQRRDHERRSQNDGRERDG